MSQKMVTEESEVAELMSEMGSKLIGLKNVNNESKKSKKVEKSNKI